MQELEVYSMIGTEGFTRLVAAFYRQIPQDDLLGPMYPATDLPGAAAVTPCLAFSLSQSTVPFLEEEVWHSRAIL